MGWRCKYGGEFGRHGHPLIALARNVRSIGIWKIEGFSKSILELQHRSPVVANATMRWRICLYTAILYLASVRAIFSDEAFQVDYHQALLGLSLPQATFFSRPQSSSNASLLYTISDNGVLGAVNPGDGSIIWRHALAGQPVQNTEYAALTAGGDGKIVSGFQDVVAAWDASNGRLIWSQNLGTGARAIAARRISEPKSSNIDFAVLWSTAAGQNIVARLSGDGSGTKWQYTDASTDVPLGLYVSDNQLYYLSKSAALLSTGKVKVVVLDQKNGHEDRHATLSLNPDSIVENSLVCPDPEAALPVVVAAEPPFKNIRFGDLKSGKVATTTFTKNAEDVKVLSIHQSCHSVGGVWHILVHAKGGTKHWAEVFHFDGSHDKIQNAYALPVTEERSNFASTIVGESQFFTQITDSEVILYSSEFQEQRGKWPRRRTGPTSTSSTRESYAIAEVVTRSRNEAAVRVAVRVAELSSNGEWSLVRNGDTQWTRPEFLANTIIASWVEETGIDSLAAELESEISSNPLTAYVHRWTRHLQDLRHFPSSIMHIFESLISTDTSQVKSKTLIGSRTVLIGTSRLEVAALNAVEFGAVKWRTDLTPFVAADSGIVSLSERDGRVTVYLSDGSFVVLSLEDGSFIEKKASTIPAHKIVEIPGHPSSTVIKINSEGSPSLATDFSPSTAVEGSLLVTIGKQGEAIGWTVGQDIQSTWTIRPPRSKFIHGVARPQIEPVSSIGKVLGDRTVLYKYLSPNLALLTAVSDSSKTLSMYLIECVSGDILYVSTHVGLDNTSTISSTISENWFAYSFTAKDPESHATTSYLISAELYESSTPNDRGALAQATNYSTLHPGSAPKPYIITQSFVLSEPITYLSVTQTGQGITNRQLLALLPESQSLVAVHRYQLDPRRPVARDPTAEEANEEGLTRYHPKLDVDDPKMSLTHARSVLGLRRVISSPTDLESTSLLFAFGHDLFGTRVTPSMAFDVLGPNFNKFQLLATVAALAVGVAALKPWSARKAVEGRWRIN